MIVIGGDPIALAIAALANSSGFEVAIVRPNGPDTPVPISGVTYWRESIQAAFKRWCPDGWTVVISATHDDDIDDDVVVAALGTAAAYVGVLGSTRRVQARRSRLDAAGVSLRRLADLHAPIGALSCGKSPWEIAVSVMAEVMQVRERRSQTATQPRLSQKHVEHYS